MEEGTLTFHGAFETPSEIVEALQRECTKPFQQQRQVLSFQYLEFNTMLVDSIVKYIQNLEDAPLTRLEVMVCEYSLQYRRLMETALKLDRIQTLRISASMEQPLTISLFQSLSKHIPSCKNLQSLELCDVSLTLEQAKLLGGLIALEEEPPRWVLYKIQFARDRLSQEYVLQGFRTNSTISSLTVHECDTAFTSKVAQALFHNPANSVSQLSLLGNVSALESTDDDNQEYENCELVTGLIEVLKNQHVTSLKEVTVSRYRWNDSQADDLLISLLSLPTVEILDLSCNAISRLTMDGIDDIDALVATSSLRSLSLASNRLSHLGPKFLEFLSKCRYLERLILLQNRLQSLSFLAPWTTAPSAFVRPLRYLRLDSNPFEFKLRQSDGGSTEASYLLQLLQASPMLGDLAFLDFGNVRSEILYWMDRNWAGRILSTNGSSNMIPLSLWPIILQRINENTNWTTTRKADAIFGLILEHCDVVLQPRGV